MQSAMDRRQALLDILMIRRHETVPNLMQELGVSRCTILRDIAILTRSHPIETVQGKGGGVYVADGYYTDRRYLKADQEALLKKLLPGLQVEDQKVMQSILVAFAKPQIHKISERRGSR